MLAEAALFLFTWVSAPRTKPAAIRDAVGLLARRRRCREAWAEHEARTRAAIQRVATPLQIRRTAVVLGSGLCADVPLAYLASTFQKVILVDICHLPSVRLAVLAKGWRNVKFVRRDLSGYDRLVQQSRIKVATGQDDLGVGIDPLAFLRRVPDIDLVVSANLLSQIAVGVDRRLAADRLNAAVMPADTGAEIAAAHLDALAQLACKTVLVTDISYVRRRHDGTMVEKVDLLHGVRPPDAFDTWEWTVAPFGEEDDDLERVHRVVAVEDVAIAL